MNAQRYPEELKAEAAKQIIEHGHSVVRICRVLRLHPSGYYAWKAKPQSPRAIDDQRLLGLLNQAWLESGSVYGYRKLMLDMRDLG